jgi:chromosome partitioning protein
VDVAKKTGVTIAEGAPVTGIVTVCSGKGGSGKTSSALGISGAFAYLGHPPVLIDVDYGGSVARSLGYKTDVGWTRALLDGAVPLEEALHQTDEGFAIVPTDSALSTVVDTAEDVVSTRWEAKLRELARDRLIVVDSSDDIESAPVTAAIMAADVLAVPVQLAKKGFDRTFPEIAGLVRRRRVPPVLVSFAVMVDPRPRLSEHWLKKLADEGVSIAVKVPRSVVVDEADEAQRTVVGYKPRSAPSQAYIALAREILAKLNERRTGGPLSVKR